MRTYIEKKDGFVFLVQENDAYGRFNTYFNLGKDPDSPMWKPKKKNEDIKKEDEI